MDTSLDYFFNTNYDPIKPNLEYPMLLNAASERVSNDPVLSSFDTGDFNGLTTQLGISNTELDKQFNCFLESNSTNTQMENRPVIASPNEGSTVSQQNPSGETDGKFPNNFISRKRKAVSKGKSQKVAVNDQENRDSKRTKTCQNEGIKNDDKQKEKQDDEPPKDYIHVRARRGQATDSHSLAERVRREKIGERMKRLQDLVPGCNKVTGKALMLDEIINYVQSLQCQVEYLSVKLATLDSSDFVTDNVLPKDVINSTYALDSSFQANTDISTHCSLNPSDTTLFTDISSQLHFVHDFGQGFSQFSGSYDDDLQSIIQFGLGQNPSSKLELHSQSFLVSKDTHNIEL